MKLIKSFSDRFSKIGPLPVGTHHLQAMQGEKPYRIHLRLQKDGSGILILNASTVLQLNPTAAECAFHFIKGTAPSDDAKNKVWEQIKLVDSNYANDLTADIDTGLAVAAAAGGGQSGGQTYTVKGGDSLSKISKQFYGDANEYMRIYYANKDKIKDPDKIQVGWELTIPQ